MWSITDWFLEKLNLVDIENDMDIEDDIMPRLEAIGQEKVNETSSIHHIFCKKIKSYDDTREVIREYRKGAECVISFYQSVNSDAQGMMNYICGGIYALEGEIKTVGENVFMVLHKKNVFL